jgi:hypothetical protein
MKTSAILGKSDFARFSFIGSAITYSLPPGASLTNPVWRFEEERARPRFIHCGINSWNFSHPDADRVFFTPTGVEMQQPLLAKQTDVDIDAIERANTDESAPS